MSRYSVCKSWLGYDLMIYTTWWSSWNRLRSNLDVPILRSQMEQNPGSIQLKTITGIVRRTPPWHQELARKIWELYGSVRRTSTESASNLWWDRWLCCHQFENLNQVWIDWNSWSWPKAGWWHSEPGKALWMWRCELPACCFFLCVYVFYSALARMNWFDVYSRYNHTYIYIYELYQGPCQFLQLAGRLCGELSGSISYSLTKSRLNFSMFHLVSIHFSPGRNHPFSITGILGLRSNFHPFYPRIFQIFQKNMLIFSKDLPDSQIFFVKKKTWLARRCLASLQVGLKPGEPRGLAGHVWSPTRVEATIDGMMDIHGREPVNQHLKDLHPNPIL